MTEQQTPAGNPTPDDSDANDGAATFAASTDHNAPAVVDALESQGVTVPDPSSPGTETDASGAPSPDINPPAPNSVPEPNPQAPEAVAVPSPDAATTDSGDVPPPPVDTPTVPATASSSDVVSEGEVTLADVHALVLDIHRDMESLKDLVNEVRPALNTALEEVKDKGIGGLIPHIMAAFRG